MKLSNKILIGFFSVIFLYLTAGFTEIRLRGNLNRMNESNSLGETVDLSSINFLILNEENHQIQVIGSDKSMLEIRSLNGDMLQYASYSISGDTLTISDMNFPEEAPVRIKVYVQNDSFRGLSSVNTGIVIDDLKNDLISISQDDGWINIKETSTVKRLNLTIKNKAYFAINQVNINEIEIESDDSEIMVYTSVDLVKGELKNDSYLNIRDSKEIQIKKDSDSRVYMN